MNRTKRRIGFSAILLGFALAASASAPAHADNLFNMLFGGKIKQRSARESFPDAPVERPRKSIARPAAAAKISAPIYYTYKADKLQPVDFSPLKSLQQAASAMPMFTLSNFRDSMPGLTDFSLLAESDIGKALSTYYSSNPEFIWVSGFSANMRAADAIRVMGEAETHGLVSAEYAVTVPPAGFSMDNTAARLSELARFEMTMSARVLRYIRDAQNGRVDPNRISGYHDLPVKPLDLPAALKTMSGTADVRGYMEGFHPRGEEYRALRVELENVMSSQEEEVTVDPKLLLKPGQTSAELPKLVKLVSLKGDEALRTEFADVIAQHGSDEVYGPELVEFFEAVQKSLGLKADGVIGPRTVSKFSTEGASARLAKVRYALEQTRWLPSELGATRVFINEPSYHASYFEDGVEKLKTRTVIGKPSNQTTFFYDEIEQVDYNPYWGVPQSIIVNEMLPRLRRDPGYLDRSGYEVVDAKGKRVSSSAVNWGAYGSKVPFGVRQAPSEANALGELKILFPNKHAIYMHDTPQKALFDRDGRAFSHGCVRLQDPRGMAAAVLGKSREYVAEMLAKGHSSEKVARKIPVYVAYFTAWPTPSGKVEYFDDIYDRDSHVKTAMELTDQARLAGS